MIALDMMDDWEYVYPHMRRILSLSRGATFNFKGSGR